MAFIYGYCNHERVYYCPKCDRTLPKDRVEQADRELRATFGNASLAGLRCPVCGSDYIDLEKVRPGGEKHVGATRRKTGPA